jgi:hypothetical protein
MLTQLRLLGIADLHTALHVDDARVNADLFRNAIACSIATPILSCIAMIWPSCSVSVPRRERFSSAVSSSGVKSMIFLSAACCLMRAKICSAETFMVSSANPGSPASGS